MGRITINTDGVHRDEVHQLIKYLEDNYWLFKVEEESSNENE